MVVENSLCNALYWRHFSMGKHFWYQREIDAPVIYTNGNPTSSDFWKIKRKKKRLIIKEAFRNIDCQTFQLCFVMEQGLLL
jgi:hypothetical protein